MALVWASRAMDRPLVVGITGQSGKPWPGHKGSATGTTIFFVRALPCSGMANCLANSVARSTFRFRVSGFGFRVSGFGFRVSGLGFRV